VVCGTSPSQEAWICRWPAGYVQDGWQVERVSHNHIILPLGAMPMAAHARQVTCPCTIQFLTMGKEVGHSGSGFPYVGDHH